MGKIIGVNGKTLEERIEKSILLADIHHPYHHKPSFYATLKFIEWFKPDRVVLLGDALEMRAIDHWKQTQGNMKYFEGKRLLKDYKAFIKDILKPIEKAIPENCEKIYMAGNHENRAYWVVSKNPQLEGLIEPEKAMNLKRRKWKWIPYNYSDGAGNVYKGMYKIGKLTITHGTYLNKYHAAKTSETFSKSIAYAHSHDRQLFTKVHEEDPDDYHSAESIGCLCTKSPGFKAGMPNRWVHSFGVVYTRSEGFFNLYVPIITQGKFAFEGKIFDGNNYGENKTRKKS